MDRYTLSPLLLLSPLLFSALLCSHLFSSPPPLFCSPLLLFSSSLLSSLCICLSVSLSLFLYIILYIYIYIHGRRPGAEFGGTKIFFADLNDTFPEKISIF